MSWLFNEVLALIYFFLAKISVGDDAYICILQNETAIPIDCYSLYIQFFCTTFNPILFEKNLIYILRLYYTIKIKHLPR